MAAQRLQLNPDEVRGWAKHVYRVSDALSKLTIDAVLNEGAGACEGTQLTTGLSRHATEQHGEVKKLSNDLDGFGDWIMCGVDAIERASGGPPSTPPPSANNRNL